MQAITNLDKIRAAFDSWISSKGTDASGWYALYHPEIEYVPQSDDPVQPTSGRPLSRKQQVREFMEYLQRDLEMLEYSVSRCIEKDDLVVSFGYSAWRVRSTERIFRTSMIKMFTFKDGLVIRLEEIYDTAAEREAHGRKPNTAPAMPLRPVLMDRG